METMKTLLVVLSVRGIFASDGVAQIVREDHIDPPIILPADPKSLPPQSPAAPTSAGAVVIRFEMQMIDKDRDGFVSRAEASGIPMLLKVFNKFDRNRDNRLDRVELEAAEQAQLRWLPAQ